MSAQMKLSGKQVGLVTCLSAIAVYWVIESYFGEREIALIIGEPWDRMRDRSSARIGAAPPGVMWGFSPKTDARLRFIDPVYGFVTPVADFFIIAFDNQKVESVVIRPQTKLLSLDGALGVVLDLQQQWQAKGWSPLYPIDNPPIADSQEWRTKIRGFSSGATTYWQAGEKYHASLSIHCSNVKESLAEERCQIKLNVAKAWMQRREEHDNAKSQTLVCDERCLQKLKEKL